MLFLLGGFVILCALLLLGYLFVNAEPARLARSLKWAGIAAAVLVLVLLAVSGRLVLDFGMIALALPFLGRIRSLLRGLRAPAAGRSSTVATPSLRMSLDHDTGAMTGTVLRGVFSGMRLEELSLAQLLALLRECRAEDDEGARLLEAYLDRAHPEWRDTFGGERGEHRPPGNVPDVGVEEAYAILGLAPGADAEAVKAAHHRLMKQLHPDHGGSDYLASKINRARDVLLQRP